MSLITLGDILEILPFEDPVVCIEVRRPSSPRQPNAETWKLSRLTEQAYGIL
jgi:hypothetical protein